MYSGFCQKDARHQNRGQVRNHNRGQVRNHNRGRSKKRVTNLNHGYRIGSAPRDVTSVKEYHAHYGNPVHVEPHHLPCLASEPLLHITPKADGVQSKLRIEYEQFTTLLQVEMIDNSAYVIDVLELTNYDCSRLNLTERMTLLENLVGMKVIHDWDDKSSDHADTIATYIHDLTIHVKPIYTYVPNVHDVDSNCKLFEELLQPYQSSYPNDGWIVYDSGKIPVKFKPIEHMTVDLLHRDGDWYVRSDSIGNDTDPNHDSTYTRTQSDTSPNGNATETVNRMIDRNATELRTVVADDDAIKTDTDLRTSSNGNATETVANLIDHNHTKSCVTIPNHNSTETDAKSYEYPNGNATKTNVRFAFDSNGDSDTAHPNHNSTKNIVNFDAFPNGNATKPDRLTAFGNDRDFDVIHPDHDSTETDTKIHKFPNGNATKTDRHSVFDNNSHPSASHPNYDSTKSIVNFDTFPNGNATKNRNKSDHLPEQYALKSDGFPDHYHTKSSYLLRVCDVPIAVRNNSNLPLVNGIYRCAVHKSDTYNDTTIDDVTVYNDTADSNTVYNDTVYVLYPRDLRYDKVIPNSIGLVRHILSRFTDPLSSEQIRNVMYVNSQSSTYYDHDNPNTKTRSHVLDIQSMRITKALRLVIESVLGTIDNDTVDVSKDNVSTVTEYICNDDICNSYDVRTMRVLDLGSGTCKTYFKIREILEDMTKTESVMTRYYLEYCGIDRDPKILSRYYGLSKGEYKIYGDMNDLDSTVRLEKFCSYGKYIDLAICVNSIHYVHDLHQFLKTLRRLGVRRLLIFAMFSDLIDRNYEQIERTNISIVRTGDRIDDRTNDWADDQTFEFSYPWKTSSFTERIYSQTDLTDAVSANGMMLNAELSERISESISSSTICNRLNLDLGIRAYLDLHKCYVIQLI